MTTLSTVIKVLQVNLNHCWMAQQLLAQTMVERGTTVAVISDFYRLHGDDHLWVQSSDSKCAVVLRRNSDLTMAEKGAGPGFAWARVGNVLIYSCYWTPNCTVMEFEQFLYGLETSIRSWNLQIYDLIVAGDFNSHSAEWGSATEDLRGAMLSGFASALDLQIHNVGTTPTYTRVNASSVVDVTFARFTRDSHYTVTNWVVLTELNSASDHEYIEFVVATGNAIPPEPNPEVQLGWSVKRLSVEALRKHWQETDPLDALPTGMSVEERADRLQLLLVKACDASMPRRSPFKRRKAVHWWNENIAELRRATIAARRCYQRAGRRATQVDRAGAFEVYNQLRKDLRLAIRKSQEASWSALCREVENDPWGVPYKLVMKRLGRSTPVLEDNVALHIARGLFPSLPTVTWDEISAEVQESSELELMRETDSDLFSVQELLVATDRLPVGKAPGPDNIPNEIIKLAARRFPGIFLDVYNACIATGRFPARWKRACLVLLHKGQNKPHDTPSSYRPLSLLDGAGKLLERMLLQRLEEYSVRSLSPTQFGFRRGRSTTDAIAEVLKIARDASSGPIRKRGLCAVVTLDVRNAFNSAPWRLIDGALRRSGVPLYLINILRSYMSDRSLILRRHPGSPGIPVTCGVPQGSVLGPTLWNFFYDGVLRLPVHENIRLIAFADDLAVIATAHNSELLEQLLNPVLGDITNWMASNGLTIAPEKSECVILTRKHGLHEPELHINGSVIAVNKTTRYLGVHLDKRLSFIGHTIAASAGARKAATALGRLMPNVGGPPQCKRSLLMSVVNSRLLYGAVVWADSVSKTRKAEELLTQAQRCAALRVTRCYKTVSDIASLVLAKMPPAHLLALERQAIGNAKKRGLRVSKSEQRKLTILRWQTMWDASTKGEWTRTLIPDIARWIEHGLTSVSFNMAQALTGHGCFQSYLWTKKRALSPTCVHCAAAVDTAEHTLFECSYWSGERLEIGELLRRQPRPSDVKDLLCGPIMEELPTDRTLRCSILEAAKRNTGAFVKMVEKIMETKQELERRRQNS